MADFSASLSTLSLPSSKRTFSQPFIEKCITEVVRNRSTLIFHLSKPMKSQILHTIWCNIFGEAAGGIWSWSVLGMKELIGCFYLPCPAPWKNLDRCSLFYSRACARTPCFLKLRRLCTITTECLKSTRAEETLYVSFLERNYWRWRQSS